MDIGIGVLWGGILLYAAEKYSFHSIQVFTYIKIPISCPAPIPVLSMVKMTNCHFAGELHWIGLQNKFC